jgi:hypothetical protein
VLHEFVLLIIASFWPFTTLVLALLFRKELKTLIALVAELKIGSSVFVRWGQSAIDRDRDEIETLEGGALQKQIAAPSVGKWKPANWFWLGSDLETTAQRTLRGAPKGKIIGGLTQIYHHMSELGLSDTAPARVISALRSDVEHLSEPELTREWRDGFAEKVRFVIHSVSGMTQAQQPDFKPNP